LSKLSQCMLERRLPKIFIKSTPFSEDEITEQETIAKDRFDIADEGLASYFVRTGILENHTYKSESGGIWILRKNGSVQDVTEASDNYNLAALKETVTKYYLTYWK